MCRPLVLPAMYLPGTCVMSGRQDDAVDMPGTTRRVIVLTVRGVYVKPTLSILIVDLRLTGLPNAVGIDTVRIVIPRLKVPLSSRGGRMRHNLARAAPAETAKNPASMVDRWRRSTRSRSPSTAQNLSASLVSGARCWGTSYLRRRRGLLLGMISIARCRLRIRVHGSHALIPQVRARDCSSSAFPKARSSRTGCILTCGSAPGSWVKSAWPHLRPNARG
jgi:hypothetical protein